MKQENYKEIAWIIKESINLGVQRTNLCNRLADYFEKRALEGIKRNKGIAQGLKERYGIFFHETKGFNKQQFLKDCEVEK